MTGGVTSAVLAAGLLAVVAIPAAAVGGGARNGRIVFEASDHQLYSVRKDGTDKVQITQRGRNESAQWSPSGARLAFTCKRPSMPFRICVSRANGNKLHFVTGQSGDAEQPTWSPNGTEILFVRSAGAYGLTGDYLIRRVLRTGEESEVTYVPQGISNPRWSPDGTRVVFGSLGIGDKRDIFSVSIDGTDLKNLTMSMESERSSDWHPDGSLIAFDRFVQGASVEEDRWDLFVMNADGANVRPVGASGNAPAWSPDGNRLAVYYLVGLNEAVFLVDANNGSRTRLTRLRLDAIDPDWQPAR